MTKAELRKIYKTKRLALSQADVQELSQRIFFNFINDFKPESGQKIHLFLSIKKFNEVDTQPFIDFCFKNNIRVFVPKMLGDSLISVELTPQSILHEHSWGIPEPAENEDSGEHYFHFVLCPLLYCDDRGNRVGYGKGFYDRFFAENETAKKIGLGFFSTAEKISDVDAFDIPLDYLVTPDAVLSFGSL